MVVGGISSASYAATHEWEAAEVEIRRNVASDPTNPAAWGMLMWVLVEAERMEEAIDAGIRAETFDSSPSGLPVEEILREVLAARSRWLNIGEPERISPLAQSYALANFYSAVSIATWTGQYELLLSQFEQFVAAGAYGIAALSHRELL